MPTVLAGLGSALGYALHDFLMVRVVRAVSLWTALTWAMAAAVAVLVPLALVVDGLPGDGEWRALAFAAASGLLEVAGLGALLRGLVTGNLSVVAPLACLSGGFAAAAVIIGGESLTTMGYVAVPLAVVGGLLASIERRPPRAASPDSSSAAGSGGLPAAHEEAGPVERRQARVAGAPRAHATAGAGWALLSSLLFAVTFLLIAGASALPPLSMAATGRLSSVLVLVPLAMSVGGLGLPRDLRVRCAAAGLFDGGAFVLLALAITLGPLAVASVTAAQSGTMAALLGLVALRERLEPLQVAGVVLTLITVTLLAAG